MAGGDRGGRFCFWGRGMGFFGFLFAFFDARFFLGLESFTGDFFDEAQVFGVGVLGEGELCALNVCFDIVVADFVLVAEATDVIGYIGP